MQQSSLNVLMPSSAILTADPLPNCSVRIHHFSNIGCAHLLPGGRHLHAEYVYPNAERRMGEEIDQHLLIDLVTHEQIRLSQIFPSTRLDPPGAFNNKILAIHPEAKWVLGYVPTAVKQGLFDTKGQLLLYYPSSETTRPLTAPNLAIDWCSHVVSQNGRYLLSLTKTPAGRVESLMILWDLENCENHPLLFVVPEKLLKKRLKAVSDDGMIVAMDGWLDEPSGRSERWTSIFRLSRAPSELAIQSAQISPVSSHDVDEYLLEGAFLNMADSGRWLVTGVNAHKRSFSRVVNPVLWKMAGGGPEEQMLPEAKNFPAIFKDLQAGGPFERAFSGGVLIPRKIMFTPDEGLLTMLVECPCSGSRSGCWGGTRHILAQWNLAAPNRAPLIYTDLVLGAPNKINSDSMASDAPYNMDFHIIDNRGTGYLAGYNFGTLLFLPFDPAYYKRDGATEDPIAFHLDNTPRDPMELSNLHIAGTGTQVLLYTGSDGYTVIDFSGVVGSS